MIKGDPLEYWVPNSEYVAIKSSLSPILLIWDLATSKHVTLCIWPRFRNRKKESMETSSNLVMSADTSDTVKLWIVAIPEGRKSNRRMGRQMGDVGRVIMTKVWCWQGQQRSWAWTVINSTWWIWVFWQMTLFIRSTKQFTSNPQNSHRQIDKGFYL